MTEHPGHHATAAAMNALELRVDGPIAPVTRRAVRLGGPEALRRAHETAAARCYDRLARDSLSAIAAARQRLASTPPASSDAAMLALQGRRLARLRRQGLAAKGRATA